MPLLLEAEKHAAVEADRLPRVARYRNEDGGESAHVLYIDGTSVRSMPAADWPPPLPTDPTQAEIDAAIAQRATEEQQRQADAAALRQKILAVAGSAVGQSIDTLTAGQVRALVACMLYKAGALDKSGVVQPLAKWL